MRKFIILFVLSLSVTYAQQGWREGVRDSILIAKGKIYDSTYTRIDSILTIIPQITSSQNIDGWYEDDIAKQTAYTPLSRGVGRYDNMFELTQNTSVVKLGAKLINTSSAYPVNVFLYKNGFNTGYKVTVPYGESKVIQSFDKDAITFGAGDNISLYYQYEGEEVLSVKAFMEIMLRENDADFPEQDNITLTALAVDSGSVQTFSLLDGEVLDSAVTTYTEGDTAMVVARSNAGYKFIGWTGTALLDETRRLDDTAFIAMTSAKTVRARFRNATQTYKVIISDPIETSDSAHAKAVQAAFLLGNEEEIYGQNVLESEILIYKDPTLSEATYQIADRYGADMIIRSTTGIFSYEAVAQKYYPTITFMPAGSTYSRNYDINNGSSPIVATGCGSGATESDTNITAYDIEWSTYHSSGASSYSNAYLAGCWYNIMLGYINSRALYNDWYGLRLISRNNVGYNNKNGYGNWVVWTKWDATMRSTYYNYLVYNGRNYFSRIDPYMQK